MWWIAAQNANAGSRLIGKAGAVARLTMKPLGDDARLVLRYAAAEQSRVEESDWETGQIALGGLFFLTMLFASREHYVLLGGILLMILLVCAERFFLTRELTAQGRMLDFAPAGSAPQTQFRVLQTIFWGVEAGKFGLGLVLTGAMVFSRRRSGRSRDARRQMDFVDKADYRRVDR